MSLLDYIEAASNVCFKEYNFSSELTHQPAEDDYPRCKTYEYLGKTTETHSKTLLTAILEKLSEENTDTFKAFHEDMTRINILLQDNSLELHHATWISKKSSEIIYDLMCFFCASEDKVKATRILYKVLDDSMKIDVNYTNVSSGGQGEGMNIPHGDYDLMTILEKIVVQPKDSKIDENLPSLVLSTDNSYPGFAHLNIPRGRYFADFIHYWGVSSEYGPVVSNKRFKEYFQGQYRNRDVVIHGPCISSSNLTVDHLFCLRSREWPQIAKQWPQRNTADDWPSAKILGNIVNEGILLVPIGSKFGATEDCSIEWRMSFSLAEKELIHSFNHTQLLVYFTIKYIKKDVLKVFDHKLCSYFLKTALFWMCEELPQSVWTRGNFVRCFHDVMKRIAYWVKYRFCPHYFIPENNLFEGILSDEKQANMLESVLLASLPLSLRSLHYGRNLDRVSLKRFKHYILSDESFLDKCKAIFILLKYLRQSLIFCTLTQIKGILSRSVYRVLHKKLSKFPKGLYLLSFCYANQIYPQLQPSQLSSKNKGWYLGHRNKMAHLLIGCNADAMTGWLLLAFYICSCQMFQQALAITEHVLNKGTRNKLMLRQGRSEDYMVEYLENIARTEWDHRISFIKQMNMSCIDFIYMVPETSFRLDKILADNEFRFEMIHPTVYAYFLRFVCFLKILNTEERNDIIYNKIISEIVSSRLDDCFVGSYKSKAVAYAVLSNIYTILGMKNQADYWTVKANRLRH